MNNPNQISKFLPALWPAFIQLVTGTLYVLAVWEFYNNRSREFFYPFLEVSLIATAGVIPFVGLIQLVFGTIRYRKTRQKKHLLHVLSFGLIAFMTAGFLLLLGMGLYPTV